MSLSFDNILRRTQRLTRIARARLVWERYAPVLASAMVAVGLFVLCAWMGVWQWVGDPVRIVALLATGVFLFRGVRRALAVRFPTISDARRRVEQDSGQAHRPLDVLDDRPALAQDVWPAHQQRALAQADKITAAKAKPTLSRIDPYYLRFALPAALLASGIYMAGFSFERLRTAVAPNWQSPVRAADISYDAWIDPPEYTGRPPIYFKDGQDFTVPAGSEFVARISGADDAPRPRLTQGWRARFLPLTRLGAQSFEVREIITADSRVTWRIGLSQESWDLRVTPDQPPTVTIVEPPEADKRDRLVLAYSLTDDFGVETLRLEMALLTDEISEDTGFDGVTDFANIPLASSAQTDVEKASAALDLSKNIWAGKKVIGRLVARDGAQQIGVSEPVYFTVPDKIFVEPLAKAVAEQRSLVMAGLDGDYAVEPRWQPSDGYANEFEPRQRLDRAPADIQRATLLIEAVTDQPAQIFKDPAVYLGLRHVRSTLKQAVTTAELTAIPEDLWKIALRAEFGVLGTALEEMREAEAALREGIARRASKREIDTLFERYNLAVEAYTEELRRQALEEGNFAEGGGGGGGAMGSVDEIQELLKAIEEANAAGDTEGARRALARLAEVLENMKIQLAKGGSGEGGEPMDGEMSEEMKKNLEELADLTGEQRDLQDETQQAERNDQPGEGQGEMDPQELAQRQAELQSMLDQLENAIPSPGEDGQAGQSDTDGDSQGGDGAGEQAGQPQPGEGQSGQNPEGGQNGSQQGGEEKPGGGGETGTEPRGGNGGGGPSTAELQQALREGIDAARRAMADSEAALRAGELSEAGQDQADAIEGLRKAGEALAEAATAQNRGKGQDGDGEGDDPLGRSDDGFNDGNQSADIDDRDNATRSRELLEELRRRAAEQTREQAERDYLERLLKRF